MLYKEKGLYPYHLIAYDLMISLKLTNNWLNLYNAKWNFINMRKIVISAKISNDNKMQIRYLNRSKKKYQKR